MSPKPTNVILVNNIDSNIYVTWLKVMEPIHKMTPKEMELASKFIDSYITNKDNIVNAEMLNNYVFSSENKRKIRLSLGMSPTYFQITMKGLKDKKFILDGKLNLQYVPEFDNRGNILLMFIIKQ